VNVFIQKLANFSKNIMFLKYLSILCLMCLINAASSSFAEVKCASQLSYSIEKEGLLTEVFFGEVRAVAADEALAKAKIDSDSLKSKTKALQQCRKLHENFSGCLHAKLESASGALKASSFSARKALEDSFLADCKKQQGNCKEVKNSEIKCETIAEKVAEPDSSAAKKDDPKKAKK
jgi:hypothetical protein